MLKPGSPSSSDTSLTCELCGRLQKDARVLPNCLHSFCLNCISTAANGNNKFTCPSKRCNVVADLGEKGLIEDLPGNPFIDGIMESSALRAVSPDLDADRHLQHPRPIGSGVVGPIPIARHRPQFKDPPSPAPRNGGTTGYWQDPQTGASLQAGSSPNIWSPASALRPDGWTLMQGSSPFRGSAMPAHAPAARPAAAENTCKSCDQGNRVTSRCQNCKDDLCEDCVKAHHRVKVTRDHVIIPHTGAEAALNGFSGLEPAIAIVNGDGATMPSTTPSSPPIAGLISGIKSLHLGNAGAAPGIAPPEVLQVYIDAVEKAKIDSENLLRVANQEQIKLEKCKNQVSEMVKCVNTQHQNTVTSVKEISRNIIGLVQNSEKLLLQRLEKIRVAKQKVLEEQQKNLAGSYDHLAVVTNELLSCMKASSDQGSSLITACAKAQKTLKEIDARCGSYAVQEDDKFHFTAPNLAQVSKLADLGHVSGSGCAAYSLADGEGIKKAILGKDAVFGVKIKDQLNEARTSGDDCLKVVVTGPDSRQVRVTLYDCQNGACRVSWRPVFEGEHVIAVTVKDKHIPNSPFRVVVRAGRNYNAIGKPKYVFGKVGESDGELCRPWGVCCTREGNILVANRSNNRIEVYTKAGKFLRNFGQGGKLPGQFDRPSSVCCDRSNRVIICDKDNHRIQIYTTEGGFLMAFGEKGTRNGQFNYPWDVACNSKDDILVSDTRNHRIQLFNNNGQFLNKYGFEGPMWKHFDSPRGVCFTIDDQIVVTDFNNHRVLVVKSDFQTAQFLGKEGSDDGQFVRPNGVAVDDEGHIIVADSRNDRIQIFSSSGMFLHKFGTKGPGPGEFDRPSGVCISPEGNIIVVDFGNERVQIF